MILLTDLFLSNRFENVTLPVSTAEDLADGNLYPDGESRDRYRRFTVTGDGISPRSLPGTEGFSYVCTGLEHTEEGMPDFTPENHMIMSAKRYRKIRGALADLPLPEEFPDDGEQLEVGVIAWGSTFGAALEAVELARSRGVKAGVLKVTALFPYHGGVIRAFMDRCIGVLVPELNYEGQLAGLIEHLHRNEVVRLARATGVPFIARDILEEIVKLAENLRND